MRRDGVRKELMEGEISFLDSLNRECGGKVNVGRKRMNRWREISAKWER